MPRFTRMRAWAGLATLAATAIWLAACGGGGGSTSPAPTPTPTAHAVTISWAPNREAAVNTAGGGYTVSISGMAPIDIPYVSGVAAPTSVSTTLMSGSYIVAITAYSALNAPGSSGSRSAPSAYAFSVPY